MDDSTTAVNHLNHEIRSSADDPPLADAMIVAPATCNTIAKLLLASPVRPLLGPGVETIGRPSRVRHAVQQSRATEVPAVAEALDTTRTRHGQRLRASVQTHLAPDAVE